MESICDRIFREDRFFKAQLASEAGRHDHAIEFVMDIANHVIPLADLSLSERKLLSASFKNFLDGWRQSWNYIHSKIAGLFGDDAEHAQLYLNRISKEIVDFCTDTRVFINRLIMSAHSSEARVCYLTLYADLSRYIVDTEGDHGDGKAVASAILEYKKTKEVAKEELTWLSPARLTLALHMSEFYSDAMGMQEKGMKIASKALDNAVKARSQPSVVEEEFTEEINELLAKLNDRITSHFDKDKRAGTSSRAGTTVNKALDKPSIQLLPIQEGYSKELKDLMTELNVHIAARMHGEQDEREGSSRTQAAFPSETDKNVETTETNAAIQPELDPILRPRTKYNEEIRSSEIKAVENAIKACCALWVPAEAHEEVNEAFQEMLSDLLSVEPEDAGTSETDAALQPEPVEEAGTSETSAPRPMASGEETATAASEVNSETWAAATQQEPVEEAGISEPGNCSTPPPPPPPPAF